MEVEQAKEAKKRAEQAITVFLNELEQSTGMYIAGYSLSRERVIGGKSIIVAVNLEMELR